MYHNVESLLHRYTLIKQQQEARKKKKREEEEANAAATSSTSVELRTWSDLPELVVDSIFTCLLSSDPDLTDFFSFSSVCRSWRSIATTSATSLTSFPPLLLLPHYKTLKTLNQATFPCKLPHLTLTLSSFLGYSNGHLIFLIGSNPLLINVFTGKFTVIRSPILSPFPRIHLAFLTPSTNHLLLLDSSSLFSYSPMTDSWSHLDLHHRITSITMFRGRIFALYDSTRLIILELDGERIGWKTTMIRETPPLPHRYCSVLCQSLVECGEDLLMLRFIVVAPYLCIRSRMLVVYRMDFEKTAWVETDDIGDWCLFVNEASACPVVCPGQGRWGGRSNCVYVAGPRCCDGWVVIRLNNGSRRARFGSEGVHVLSEELEGRDGCELI